MNLFIFYSITFRSVRALSNVIESINSISVPIGTPLAILVTFIFKSSNLRALKSCHLILSKVQKKFKKKIIYNNFE